MRLLIVEDDPRLARVLARGLREESYAVDTSDTGKGGIAQAVLNNYDALILDVMLPDMDGFTVMRILRERSVGTPVLMLTARDTVADRIAGLDSGADDYLVKPFDFGELLARVRALLRRPESVLPMRFRIDDLEIDFRSHGVWRGGSVVSLTTKEYSLLEILARNMGHVLSRSDIVAHVWDDNHDPFTNALEVYVNRLRGKIDKPGMRPLIHTRRGAGYMLTDNPPI